MHAAGPAAKFAGSLRPSKEQFANNGSFAPIEIENFLHAVLEFPHAIVHTIRRAGEFFKQTGNPNNPDLFYAQYSLRW